MIYDHWDDFLLVKLCIIRAELWLAPALRKNSINLALCDNFIGFDHSGFHHEKNQWCRRPFIRCMIGWPNPAPSRRPFIHHMIGQSLY